MNREVLYDDDDDDEEEDDIGEDLEELRRACMVSDSKPDEDIATTSSVEADVGDGGGGGRGIPSDSENEDDFEMLRSIKSQLGSSTDVDMCSGLPMALSVPSDSESEEDDFEMLRSIKSQLALSMDVIIPSMSLSDDDEDDSFETLRAIRRRFSAYQNLGPEGNFMDDSPGKKKQVHASDNEPSSKILSRSNTCESFPDQGKSLVTMSDSEEVQAGHYVDLHENSATEPLDRLETCQSSLVPVASSSFPESAQAFFAAIQRNRSYQKFLRSKLTEIEATIEQNEKHQANVKIVKDFQVSCKRKTKQALSHNKDPRVELISTRKTGPPDNSEGTNKKTSPLMLGPPENPGVANYRMALQKYPASVDRRNWSALENENLAKGLKQQLQETLISEAFKRSSDLEGGTGDTETIMETIKNFEITPEMIRQFLPRVNWDQLASTYIKDRSAAECEARWMSSEDPLIYHGPWTAEEDNNLRLIIQGKSFTDWLDIAVSLGTNRTPFQCLARYQRSLNADIMRKEWTAEEDVQLRAAVDLIGEKDWQSVANVLEGRTGTQCSTRWMKTLHPNRKRVGKWSSEEDKRIKVAVTLFGAKNWHKIAQFVPGRTQPQCRERWVNCLDPKIHRGKWTEEEDAKLGEAISEHGYSSWSKVASHLSGRTDNQCWRRWKNLYPEQVPIIQEANRLRRKAIVGNFVDRESERPALVAGNFLALPGISLDAEPKTVALKKKPKARQKRSQAEASCDATKRHSKRRRKLRQENETNFVDQESECPALVESNFLALPGISLEPEPSPKKKRKARQKKSDAEHDSEASAADTERKPKRRRNGLERCSGDEIRQENEAVCENDSDCLLSELCHENKKEKLKRRRNRTVEETSNNSTVTSNCSQVKVGIQKLRPRRKVSTIVHMENQDAPN